MFQQKTEPMPTSWINISLGFFFVVALIGTSLRLAAFVPLPLEYAHLVHAHSHVAFQGWIYTLMMLLLVRLYLSPEQIRRGRYPLQFQLTAVVLCGVLVAFSLQGYGLYSILFSTLFQLLNYWFIFSFFKHTKTGGSPNPQTLSLLFIKTGLWAGLLSTLLPFGIGILSAKGLAETEIYHSFVYTFLHLQYNGWFLFVALGLFYKFLEINAIPYSRQYGRTFFWLFALALLPAIGLSLLGMSFWSFIFLPAMLAAVLQGLGLLFFLLSLSRKLLRVIGQKGGWFQLYLLIFLLSFLLKVVLQSFSVLPFFREYVFSNKLLILAYLHLSFIGFLSFLLLALLVDFKWLPLNRLSKAGSVLLPAGFVGSELLLLLGGTGLHYNHLALAGWSAAMALGILLLLLGGLFEKRIGFRGMEL